MSIIDFMAEAGLSGVGLLAFFVFRQEKRIRSLEEQVEKLLKELATYKDS